MAGFEPREIRIGVEGILIEGEKQSSRAVIDAPFIGAKREQGT